jgi:hypothetical protein
MPAQGQPGRGEQEGERQGGEPQYLAGQYRRSGVMGKGVRHPACRAGAALGCRGVLSGAGLGAGAGVISGKSPDAFPAPTNVGR